MKKSYFGIFLLIIFFAGCTSSSQPAPSSGDAGQPAETSSGMTLDQAIAAASVRIDERIVTGSKIAPINFNSPSDKFSSYVLDELTANLVDSRKLIVVDRKEVDLIRNEFKFQLSGEVGDDSMQDLGRMLGAQSIISGSLTDMGGFYRIVIRVLNVQNASVEVQYRSNIVNDPIVTALLDGGRSGGTVSTATTSGTGRTSESATPSSAGGQVSGVTTTTSGGGQSTQPAQPVTQTNVPVITTPSITGTIVPGDNLTEKLAWLQRSVDSHNTYILEVNANENIAPHTFEYKGAINVTVVLRGDSENRTIRLRSHGRMFTVKSNVTFILDNNITLQGHNGNNGSIVYVNGGTFKMNTGATITGNSSCGVYIDGRGTFEMTSGTISNNTASKGGGVYISGGTFIMSGGTISNNTASYGGGVYTGDFSSGGTFTMSSGTISNNTASYGGGVSVDSGGDFIMRSGIITGNTATINGGGVHSVIWGGSRVGTITKTGGTITGYGSDPNNGNVVRDGSGNVLARRGHAVYVTESLRKEATAGMGVNLSCTRRMGSSGAWDN